jgi:hypothetical protein
MTTFNDCLCKPKRPIDDIHERLCPEWIPDEEIEAKIRGQRDKVQ